jgi:23S rRNA (adenine2503-C2)-methyltransferase
MAKRINLPDLDRQDMEAFFTGIGEKPYRASQALKWIHQYGVVEFDCMSNLGRLLREKLHNVASIMFPEIIGQQISEDGTHKWLIRVDDNNCIETVYIPETDRGTLCVSSQVGCPLDCSFCSTGKQGFNRNLTVSEIIGQVWIANKALGYYADRRRIITNVVLMGMGEPLLNMDNVIKATNLMTDDLAYGLSRRRVTLSTAGVVPAMEKLAKISNISLAVSLHAANDKLRDVLVPLNRKYPISQLMAASRQYSIDHGGEPVTFEYVMMDAVNDSEADARELAKLLQGMPAKVNLIPFNPFPGTEYKRSTPEAIDRFRNILINAGIMAITRKTRGDDIDAACGQLVGKVAPRAIRYHTRSTVNLE